MGWGIKQDFVQAARLYRKAAESGNAQGQYQLSILLFNGKGVPQNPQVGLVWLSKSAEQGFPKAQKEMGYIYFYGSGIPKDTVEAAKWFGKLSDSGQADGDFGLGLILFEQGQRDATKYGEAAKWIRRAAEKEHPTAQNYLAVMYANGLGIERDQNKAISWFRKAAEQDEVAAEYSLGHIYEDGLGVPIDRKIALGWYRKSANHGYQPAAEKARMLEMKQ